MGHPRHASPGRQLHAVDEDARDAVGEQLPQEDVALLAGGKVVAPVEPARGARAARQLLQRDLEGQGSAVEDREGRVRLPRLEVPPGGAGQAGQLRDLLLGEAAGLPELAQVARQPAGQIVVIEPGGASDAPPRPPTRCAGVNPAPLVGHAHRLAVRQSIGKDVGMLEGRA